MFDTLPNRKMGPFRVSKQGHFTCAANFMRAHQKLASGGADSFDTRINILHREINCPVAGNTLLLQFGGQLIHGTYILMGLLQHGIGAFRHGDIFGLPTKESTIKVLGTIPVLRPQLDPAGFTMSVCCNLHYPIPFQCEAVEADQGRFRLR